MPKNKEGAGAGKAASPAMPSLPLPVSGEAIEVGGIQIPGLRGLAKFVREFVAAKPSNQMNVSRPLR